MGIINWNGKNLWNWTWTEKIFYSNRGFYAYHVKKRVILKPEPQVSSLDECKEMNCLRVCVIVKLMIAVSFQVDWFVVRSLLSSLQSSSSTRRHGQHWISFRLIDAYHTNDKTKKTMKGSAGAKNRSFSKRAIFCPNFSLWEYSWMMGTSQKYYRVLYFNSEFNA